MKEPLNPNHCYGCQYWNYRCVAPEDIPCGNAIRNSVYAKTCHTRKEVEETIRKTFENESCKSQEQLPE